MPCTIIQIPEIRLNRPDSSARVIAPVWGRAHSTTPNAIEISPAKTNSARVLADSLAPKAAGGLVGWDAEQAQLSVGELVDGGLGDAVGCRWHSSSSRPDARALSAISAPGAVNRPVPAAPRMSRRRAAPGRRGCP